MENQISTIAVLGAGTMGRGIAHVSAQAGYQTHLYDTSAEALKKAEAGIHKNLAKGVELKKVDPEVAERARHALSLYDNLLDAVERADLIIESVPESINLKIETFRSVALHAQ